MGTYENMFAVSCRRKRYRPKPAFMGDCLSYTRAQGCWPLMKLQQSGVRRRQDNAGQHSTLGAASLSPDSKAMDGAFAALSWDDSAVKAN